MTRFIGRHIAPEMLVLLVLEACLSFFLGYLVLSPGGFDTPIDVGAAHHALIIALTVGFTSFLLGLYRPQLFMRTRSLLLTTALGGVLAFPAVWAVSSILDIRSEWIVGHDRFWPTKILLVWIAALFTLRLGFHVAVRLKVFVRRVAVVGAVGDVAATVAATRAGRAGFFEIVTLPAAGGAASGMPQSLKMAGIRVALTSLDSYEQLSCAVKESYRDSGIDLEAEPVFWERHLKRVDIAHLHPSWFAALDRRAPGRFQATLNRSGDIVISLALLLFTLPLMLMVALLVRLDSPGPVLYRQERVGLGGATFVLLKFRSMNCNAEIRGPAWAQQRDPRVTRVGAFMRRTRIDELPQLLNVLRGQMSFIGPRPERPHFVEKLSDVIPYYRERARVKPGLTGWAQVNYPYGASIEDARAKLSYDLFYVQNRSILLDILILFATVRVILFQEGSR